MRQFVADFLSKFENHGVESMNLNYSLAGQAEFKIFLRIIVVVLELPTYSTYRQILLFERKADVTSKLQNLLSHDDRDIVVVVDRKSQHICYIHTYAICCIGLLAKPNAVPLCNACSVISTSNPVI